MLKLVLYIIILLLVLSFFGVSLQHVIESPAAQANFKYVGQLLAEGWQLIIAQLSAFWSTIF
jgi:hypothetical protein